MEGDGREWLASQPLPETAREQITVAMAMIDALERQIAPLDRELRPYARRQTGCKALSGSAESRRLLTSAVSRSLLNSAGTATVDGCPVA